MTEFAAALKVTSTRRQELTCKWLPCLGRPFALRRGTRHRFSEPLRRQALARHAKHVISTSCLLSNDAVAIQETRGVSADVFNPSPNPPLHRHVHAAHRCFHFNCRRYDSCCSSGLVHASHGHTHTHTRVHMQGRAITDSLQLGHWYHLCAIHVDASLTSLTTQRLLRGTASYHADLSGVSCLLGDWNFVPSDETRLVTDAGEVRSDSTLATCFDDVLQTIWSCVGPSTRFVAWRATRAHRRHTTGWTECTLARILVRSRATPRRHGPAVTSRAGMRQATTKQSKSPFALGSVRHRFD